MTNNERSESEEHVWPNPNMVSIKYSDAGGRKRTAKRELQNVYVDEVKS